MTVSLDSPPESADPRVVTLGCRLNAYESEIMGELARSADLQNAVIVNTCAVTAEAERQARQLIRRHRRENPTAQIIATGCAAQISPESFAEMPEVDVVLGNADKMRAESYRRTTAPKAIQVGDLAEIRDTAPHLLPAFENRARAFLQIQNGCDHRCTFCVIPQGRGPSYSTPMGVIVEQVRRLVANGFHEVVLSGVDLTSYGSDLPGRPALGQMLRRLLRAVPELPRLRLSSVDPAEIDPDLLALLADEPRLMPHLHLSIQSGDDLILKRMKRRHSRHQVIDLVKAVMARRPDAVFGADFIAGFPTETEEMAARSLDLVDACGLIHLHVFPYSPREGTPAARMPQVPAHLRRDRAAAIRAAGERQLAAYLRTQIGRPHTLLMETPDTGRTAHFARASLGRPAAAGALVEATITGATATTLQAQRAA